MSAKLKKEKEIKIEHIVLDVCGKKLILSVEEAKRLHDELSKLYDVRWVYPYWRYPSYPSITWTCCDGTDATPSVSNYTIALNGGVQ